VNAPAPAIGLDGAFARTDRTWICIDCRLRIWPVVRCPECRRRGPLRDLARDPGAIELAPGSWIRAVREPRRGMRAALLGLGDDGELPTPAERDEIVARPVGPLRLAPGPLVRDRRPRARAAGVARSVGELLVAPISGRRCIAWVLEASLPTGPLLDASGTVFEVERDDGARTIVDATVASLDLSADEAQSLAPLPEPVSDAVRAFLGARAARELGSLATVVGERALVPGARVEVAGFPSRIQLASGYRGAWSRAALSDEPGAPLRVRLRAAERG